MQVALNRGQRPVAELVDRHGIRSRTVRTALIRYLTVRRPAMDYASLYTLVSVLAGVFWADIERHHPDIDSLHLPEDVALAWKERVRRTRRAGRPARTPTGLYEVLTAVRGFYLDIAEWAHHDPSWAQFAAPSPVRRGDTAGFQKARQQVTARMNQRVRTRLPQVDLLVEAADRHRTEQRRFLEAAQAVEIGATFVHDEVAYLRGTGKTAPARLRGANVVVVDLATMTRLNLTRSEDDAFWGWAIVETLRHTGIRIEELLELTQLALVSYRLPSTGEVVPLLQIVPSKGNQERLLLVSPELASVLATIITRLRAVGGGSVPIVSRFDIHERVTGPPLPLLFQRRVNGQLQRGMSYHTVYKILRAAVAHADLRDPAGEPLHFTPHDFRRIFATEAVTGGLPIHIAARVLGHQSVTTTQAYHAVFQDDLVRAYRSFLDSRRAARP
ncbi:tyrosine-type recombinase/integrase, partial [Pseudonocardia asaccharolytica]|uniref:tyrosine-type recombinase/integrase n=1 Tax=Pseudonocardia asaccharolytica TaxID=54010 RepID=UPI0011BD9F66